jgi:hypothetical protein
MGSAAVGTNGSFSKTIAIAAGTPPGLYSLVAERSGAIEASTPITIVKAGQFAPLIRFIEPTLGTSSSTERVTVGNNLTVRGEGFASGPVRISLDTLDGTVLATATASGTPSIFQVTFPYNGAPGAHQIVASQSQGERVLQATGTIQAEITQ